MNINIPNYQLKEEIFQSERTIIYRAIRSKDQLNVIIKILNEEYPSNDKIARFKHEFNITKKFTDEGVIHAHEQVKCANSLALILESFDGQPIADLLENESKIDLKPFLQLSIEISKSLGEIHQKNIIHKDINPQNILINKRTKKIKIIDFGISTELSREKQDVNVANQLEGSLAYISPEQTGRMNRELDYRTDYYSLGVTFFEMLTGSRPFEADDTIGWLHCHIAKTPPPCTIANPSTPEVVSDIIMKLLSKNSEDRYQSSNGIVYDLEECLRQLEQNGSIDDFELGRGDVSKKFQTPQKLLGRENELETLKKAFNTVAAGGMEYLLVSGYSGVGKSALVHEVHKPIVQIGRAHV